MNNRSLERILKIIKTIRLWVADIPIVIMGITGLMILIVFKNPRTRELTKEYIAYYGCIALILDVIL